MKIITAKTFSANSLLALVRTSQSKQTDVKQRVEKIIAYVRKDGDRALFALAKKLESANLKTLAVSRREIAEAYAQEGKALVKALKVAKANIEKFHKSTFRIKEPVVETAKGVRIWREFRPIEKVGLYVPGGKAAYPSTVLMLAVPAKIAGCKDIVLCTPPQKNGKVAASVLVAADLSGITRIFKVGGAQAIAAMAYGTESVPKVYKIFGPGNQFVTAAKMSLYGKADIDMPAGPSEVLVMADDSANPAWVAADLLSQLEHAEDSQAILVTLSLPFGRKVRSEVLKQAKQLPRLAIIRQSLKNSFIVIFKNQKQACEFINAYAPEHLEIIYRNEKQILKNINNAGSVFLGQYASEPLGDYITGSNHTLPTAGFAKMFSALSAESYGKKIQIQKVSKTGIKNLRLAAEILATTEGLSAHKNAISIRFKQVL